MKRSFLVVTILALSIGAASQDAKAPVKLKDNIALEIRTLQYQFTLTQGQQLQLKAQYDQLQAQAVALQKALNEKLASALKDSDIDPEKYTLDGYSLTITPKK